MGDYLEREENSHTQQVKKIVDGGSGEGTFKLSSVGHLSHGYDGVCDGGTDVGSLKKCKRDRRCVSTYFKLSMYSTAKQH